MRIREPKTTALIFASGKMVSFYLLCFTLIMLMYMLNSTLLGASRILYTIRKCFVGGIVYFVFSLVLKRDDP